MAEYNSRSRRQAEMAENPILWVLKITGILILAAMLSAAGCEESPISPEGGFFDGPVDVTLNYPGATEIFYTLDGSEPGSNCLTYTQGDVITLDSSTVLKVRSKTAGADPEYSEISTATFSFVDNINPNNDTSTNRQALLAWVEYESTTRQVFADKYFGGCEPIVGCGGGLDLGQLGIYYICDVDNSITDPNACGNAGGGWISWEVTQQGLGGGSEFIYNNYSISLAEGGSLSATGAVVGRFDSGGSGSTNTDEGETITISGAYNASVDDAITVSSRAKSGGSYFISCTDAGCDNGGINYLVTAGPNFQRIEPSASSCATAPDFLRLQQEGLCLGKFSFGPFAGLEACNNDITNQQWDIVENFDTEAEDFHIVQKDTTGCLSAKPIDGSGLNGYDILTCIGNDPTQTFSFEKSEDAVGEEVRIVAAEGAIPGASGPLCLTTLSGTQVPIIIAQDCSDPAKDFDFSVVLGNTFPVEYLDPTTDLIPPPVPVSFDFSQFDGGYGISSLSFTEGDITVTATAINGQGVTQTAQGLGRGRGAFTYLMGRGEELNFSWSESVDIDAIVLNSYGDATVTWTYSDGTVSNNSHVDAKEGGYSTQLDLKDVTNVRVSANSNFVIVKGFNTVVPAQ